jgi:hypothetical protein
MHLTRLRSLAAFGALAALAATAAPVAAQRGLRPLAANEPPLIQITPYVGYMFFGNTVRGSTGAAISMRDAPVYGAELGVRLTRVVSVVGNVAYSRPNLQIGQPFLGGIGVGYSRAWAYDGAVRLSPPMPGGRGSSARPFVQLGVGSLRLDVRAPNYAESSSTNVAFNVGLGLDVRLRSLLGVQMLVKDYIGRFGGRDASGADISMGTSNNWALTAGLRLGF